MKKTKLSANIVKKKFMGDVMKTCVPKTHSHLSHKEENVKIMYQTTCCCFNGKPSHSVVKVRVVKETKHFVYLYDDWSQKYRKASTTRRYHKTLLEAMTFICKTTCQKVEEAKIEIKRACRELVIRRESRDAALRLLENSSKSLKEVENG